MHRLRRVAAGVAVIAAVLTGTAPPSGASDRTPEGGGYTVDLVTGDRVTVADGRRITFTPGAGRAGTRYAVQETDGRLYVIPTDVLRSVADGTLDRDRFAVAGTDQRRLRPAPRLGADEGVLLTVRYRDRAGRPTPEYLSRVRGVDNDIYADLYDADGTVEIRLPKGRYVVDTWLRTDLDTAPRDHLLVAPGVDLTDDSTVEMDARGSKPYDVTVEDDTVRPVQTVVGFSRLGGAFPVSGSLGADGPGGLYSAQIGPALPDSELVSFVLSRWAVPGADGEFRNSPVSYGLMDTRRGAMFTGLRRDAKNRELAAVTARRHAQVTGRAAVAGRAVLLPEQPWAIGYGLLYDQPSVATDYLEPGSEWFAEVSEVSPGVPGFVTQQYWPMSRSFTAGRHAETWNAAVFGPALTTEFTVERDGEYFGAAVPVFSDGAGHSGWSLTDSASTRLYRDGELVAEGNEPGTLPRGTTGPAEKARYRLETSASREGYSDFSTRVDAAWEFESAATTERTPLPLWAIRFQPSVDAANRIPARPVTVLPFTVRAQPGAEVGTVTTPSVEISGDDGTSWKPARVVRTGDGRYLAVVRTPAHASYLSVRAKAADTHGNTVDQTILRAVALSR
jgi:hypothetical protein